MMEEWQDMVPEELQSYAQSNMLKVEKQIGFGIHGRVFLINSLIEENFSVAKVFDDDVYFERELAVYLRLRDLKIQKVGRFHVPGLVGFDPRCRLIEMTLVTRPFCLDFASAYLDELPSYFPPFDEDWHQDKENQFGSDSWPEVLAVVRELESLGICQTDVSPSNIAL